MHSPLYALSFPAALGAALLLGCPTAQPLPGDSGTPAARSTSALEAPLNAVLVGFTIDDSANAVFADGELEWKGSFAYDAATNTLTRDPTWSGPFPTLFDDGPLSAGGHEPEGATAGDHRWGIAVWAIAPLTGADAYEYGANDKTVANGWLWRGTNGSFAVAAGATEGITAGGLVLPPFGTTDFKVTIDTSALAPPLMLVDAGAAPWDVAAVAVKGSAWMWTEIPLVDDGSHGDEIAFDGKFTFVLSEYVGRGNRFPHSGLLSSGDSVEFVFVFGGMEYKSIAGVAHLAGVEAFTRPAGAALIPSAVTLAANANTHVVVP